MDLDTRHRGRAAVSQLVRRERGDGSFLNGADLVWECTGVKMKVDNVHVIDGIGAVVSDRFYNQGADFLGIRLVPHSGGEFRIVGTRHHEKETTVRVEDIDTPWISPKLAQLAAIRAHLIR